MEWFRKNFNHSKIENYSETSFFKKSKELSFQRLAAMLSGSTISHLAMEYFDEKTLLTDKMGSESLDLQVYLGHYFRNLFGLYKYVDRIENEKLKVNSQKMIKNQLSTYEQSLIFLNSLASIGEVWEVKGENKFFNKFNVIGNIPKGMLKVVDPKDYYPNVRFEYEDYS